MKRHIFFIVLVCVLGFWSVVSLTSDGYFPMHDDTQTGRVVAMGRALRNGQFPVRWVSDLGYGYGYPIFNFYGPLPYYFGGFLYALGAPATPATKAMFAVGLVLSALTMYALMSMWGRLAGLVGSVLYLYAPYHAVDVYVRGAVGEYWAMAFLPLIVLGGVHIIRRQARTGITIGGLGIAGVVVSHTILGFVTVVAAFVTAGTWVLLSLRSVPFRKTVVPYVLLIAAGLGLSAFFWLPAIAEMHYTNVSGQVGGTADFRLHFVCLEQLWNSAWGFGGSAPGCIDGISFMAGKIHLLAAFIAMILLGFTKARTRGGLVFIMGTLLSLFFLLPISEPLWERISLFSYIQYPWRFLTFTVLCLSALSGLGVAFIKQWHVRLLYAALLIVLCIAVNRKFFQPQYTYVATSSGFEAEEDLKFRVSSISDEYLPPEVPRPKDVSGIVRDTIQESERVSVSAEWDTETYSRFAMLPKEESVIRIQRAYFPGWVYKVNGSFVTPDIHNGLPYIRVPAKRTVVELIFRDTPIRTLANLISACTVVAFVLIYGKKTFG